jgi:D-alanyl-D-alanine carboxypeptidase
MTSFLEVSAEDVPQQSGYGLGLRRLVIDEQEVLGHTGTIPGYSAIVMHNQREGYTIAVMSNLSVIDQTGLYGQLQCVVRETEGPGNGSGVPEERPR